MFDEYRSGPSVELQIVSRQAHRKKITVDEYESLSHMK